MASPASHKGVSDAGNRVFIGPTVGFCDASTSIAEEYVDLSAVKGRDVTIYAETNDHYICFSSGTANVIILTAQAWGTAGVPLLVHAEAGGAHPPMYLRIIVPSTHPYLHYRTVAGAGVLRVVA